MEFALRHRIRQLLEDRASRGLRAFGDAIMRRDGERFPCWGNLADTVTELADGDLVELWCALIQAGDRRPLLVLLDIARTRAAVLGAIAAELALAPVDVQCAFVSMQEAEPVLGRALPHLCAAARELAGAGADAMTRERMIYGAHMASLRSQRAAAPSRSGTMMETQLTEVFEAAPDGDLA